MSEWNVRRAFNAIFSCFTWALVLVPAFMAWFVYDDIKASIAIFFLGLILMLVGAIGYIPVLGQIIYWFIARNLIIPYYLEFLSIEPTWLTSLIFWMGFLCSIGFSGKSIFDTINENLLM